MWGDEVGYGVIGETIIESQAFKPFTYDIFAPPSPYMYLIGWTVRTFGRSMVSLRFWSVFFGALSVPLLYLFFKYSLHAKAALLASVIFLTLYHHLIVSRFTYEMSIGIFFEILTLFSLYFAWKKKTLSSYILVLFSICFVLYTYLALRTFAVAAFILLLGIVVSKKGLVVTKITQIVALCLLLAVIS